MAANYGREPDEQAHGEGHSWRAGYEIGCELWWLEIDCCYQTEYLQCMTAFGSAHQTYNPVSVCAASLLVCHTDTTLKSSDLIRACFRNQWNRLISSAHESTSNVITSSVPCCHYDNSLPRFWKWYHTTVIFVQVAGWLPCKAAGISLYLQDPNPKRIHFAKFQNARFRLSHSCFGHMLSLMFTLQQSFERSANNNGELLLLSLKEVLAVIWLNLIYDCDC